MANLYAVLDINNDGTIIHNVVSIDISDQNNIAYIPFGIIAGLTDKYFVSATLDPIVNKLFVALSDASSNTSVENLYLYTVTFPDLLTVTPFCVINTIYVNLNPQISYNLADNLFYYAINNDPSGYDYKVNTINSTGNIIVTSINTTNIQNSSNGLQIFNDYVYASYRPGNSFEIYYAGIDNNTTGTITSSIFPSPPGQIWSCFDLNGILWGTTQIDASSPPSLSLYQLQCTTDGLPASDPFFSQLIGEMPVTFNDNAIANVTLFTPSSCIHGSSQVSLANGTQKQISKLMLSDSVLCPNGETAKIKHIVPCWNHMPDHPSQSMIVFEKNSICLGIPSEVFAIDPNHPMCTIGEYLKDGKKALRYARTFMNDKTIYSLSIDNIHNRGILDKNIRYDLVLEKSDVFIANGLVVKARQSFRNTGF